MHTRFKIPPSLSDIHNSGSGTWFNAEASNFEDLWGGISKQKSVYDPCPAGYKIPIDSREVWKDFNADQVEATETTFGGTINGAFYACAGQRNDEGKLSQLGIYAKAQSATWSATKKAYIMQLGYNKSFTGSYKASFTNMGQNSLAIAVPVRCVKE